MATYMRADLPHIPHRSLYTQFFTAGQLLSQTLKRNTYSAPTQMTHTFLGTYVWCASAMSIIHFLQTYTGSRRSSPQL